MKSEKILMQLKDGREFGRGEQIRLVFLLSVPAILAQITSIVMQYIDASMVGSLGAEASASIGLVSSSTWLFSGVCGAVASGFSIQAAHRIGGGKIAEARSIMRQSLLVAAAVSLLLALSGVLIGGKLPVWLGAAPEIWKDASAYFIVFACSLPLIQMNRLAGGLFQCSGDMRTPGALNILMCFLDVVFNRFLIFPAQTISVGGLAIPLPGAGLGVTGAALGTALSELVTAVLMMGLLCLRSGVFRLKRGESWKLEKKCIMRALRLAAPIGWENVMMCGAMVATTRVVAPLGAVAIAANSFAVTAESLCYMPGYGIGDAAATLTGQSIGAGRYDLTRRFAKMAVWMGIVVMALTGAAMFFGASFMMSLLTPDMEIRRLGAEVLRIEVFAEPMYAASIVASGALRGAGDTMVPSMMNFASIWFVRLPLAILLSGEYGLRGVWIAMCLELCFRGAIFLLRLYREKWLAEAKKEQINAPL
ncbi:MAG: MATE family efflux transporter [Blautia sp.]|nr:MATE family efflux transporter [Blautia sp.]MCM1201232.1 MATE family efflux transporter [Bacteroides fragilis]